MGFLKEMGAAIGVGNLDVLVDCDRECHHGEGLRGVATLKGGQVPQLVQGLEVRLLHLWEVWDEERRREVERSKVIHRRPVPFQAQVLPGSTHEVPFLLDIPVGATLADHGEWTAIQVESDISGGVDVSGRRSVLMWPIRPVADTVRAIAAATGWSIHGFQPRKARSGFVRAVLTPSEGLAHRFDRVNLDLALDQGMMRIHATLDMKEGVWKTLTGGDEHDYAFAAQDIPTIVAGLQGLIHKHAHGP